MGTEDDTKHQDRWAKSDPIIHPDFNFTYKNVPENDFAMIHVKADFVLNEYVGTICLPESTADYDPTECYATGYGKDRWGKFLQLSVMFFTKECYFI